ncbi:MAG: hypothetical protein MJA83_03335 [Gammaproteobacteria bacterium]|nr:hypothetical protein [Gammaproteobacteria bacterium]
MVDHSAGLIRNNYIKMYGMERTFTTYSKLLIEQNMESVYVLVNMLSWKHGLHPSKFSLDADSDWVRRWFNKSPGDIEKTEFPLALARDTFAAWERRELQYYVATKNPYAWYVSYARYKSHPKDPFKRSYIERAFKHWNSRYESWMKLCSNDKNAYVWRYEDFVEKGLDWYLDEVSSTYNLVRKSKVFDTKKKLVPGGQRITPSSVRRYDHDLTYYSEMRYMKEFNTATFCAVRDAVDWDIAHSMGYKYDPLRMAFFASPSEEFLIDAGEVP